jgi:AcrR family transcriptional regulator
MAEQDGEPVAVTATVTERVIAAAIQTLASTGPHDLKARAVAAQAGLSTMAVYNYFGGMPELTIAVIDEGFRRLGAAFAAVPVSADPVTDLFTMALVCRQVARANPHLYDLMFGLSTRQARRVTSSDTAAGPSGRSPAFQSAYAHLVCACQRLTASGRIRPEDPQVIAAQLWSFTHGFIALELADHFIAFSDPVAQVLAQMGRNFLVGLGDDLDHATTSTLDGLDQFLAMVPLVS